AARARDSCARPLVNIELQPVNGANTRMTWDMPLRLERAESPLSSYSARKGRHCAMKRYVTPWYRVKLVYVAVAVLLIGVTIVSVLVVPRLSFATAASSVHSLPNRGVAGVTYTCGPTGGYACTAASGYTGSNVTGWAKAKYGCPFASGCAHGTPHNCTL